MKRIVALLVLIRFSASAIAVETILGYSVQPVFYLYNNDSYIDVPSSYINKPDIHSKQLLEMTLMGADLSFTATAKHTLETGGDSESDLAIKELVYSNNFSDWDISLGRKISSWGVGLAYRPLDVVQREDLLSSDQETLKGVNQIAVERYDESAGYGVYFINPGEKLSQTGARRPAVTTRYTDSGENADWQALLGYSDENYTQIGSGVSYILTDAMELHASALYSSRFQRRQHRLAGQSRSLLATSNPWQNIDYNDGLNWLVGGNYTWTDKHNVMFEYWHNDRALSKSQWNEQIDLIRNQNNLLDTASPQAAVYGNLAWSAEAFRNTHLIQDNIFLRYQYQGDNVIPRASLLFSPADSSYRLSAQVTLDQYPIKYNTGVRYYSGDKESVYGQLPYSAQLYFTVYGNF